MGRSLDSYQDLGFMPGRGHFYHETVSGQMFSQNVWLFVGLSTRFLVYLFGELYQNPV